MQRKNKKTRLAILSVVAGVIYLMIVASYFVRNWESGRRAFIDGYERGRMSETENKLKGYYVFTLDLVPKNHKKAYTDSLKNIKNGRDIPVCHQRVEARYKYSQPISRRISVYESILTVISVLILIIYFLIPFLFYKLIISFYNDFIFTYENVRRLRRLAVYSIAIYVLQLTFNISYFSISNSLIDFVNYKQIMPDMDHEILLTGIVLLIAGNVLKRAIVLKEEQGLTI